MFHGVGRFVGGSGSLLHSHQSSSPPCHWHERSWTDSLHLAHTPCTTCQEDSPLLYNVMSAWRHRLKRFRKSQKMTTELHWTSQFKSHECVSYRWSTGEQDSPRQTWVLQVLLWRLRPLQSEELQTRERDCCPPPQLTEHKDHWDHGSHRPAESRSKNILWWKDTIAL